MIQIAFNPTWFYGKDILIDIFSLLVLSIIAVYSIKYYKLNHKNKNYFWFSVSFFSLALSFFFKILTNFTIYYNVIKTQKFGPINLIYKTIETSNIFFSVGFLLYVFLTLLGFFILFETYQKNRSWQQALLTTFFIASVTYFTEYKYFVFHLAALAILSLITLNYFQKIKNNSMLLPSSFLIILFSQLLFIFTNLNQSFYVLAEIIQLIGYILLLATFIGVFKNVKKKQN